MTKSTTSSGSKKTDPQDSPYAIVEASGQQFWLQKNRYYDFDRLKAKVDETVTIENVLLVNDGKKTILGKPFINGSSVKLKVLSHKRGPKILVYKMRPKKKTRSKNGHRQELTRVLVESISTEKKSTTKTASKESSKVSTKSTATKKVSKEGSKVSTKSTTSKTTKKVAPKATTK